VLVLPDFSGTPPFVSQDIFVIPGVSPGVSRV